MRMQTKSDTNSLAMAYIYDYSAQLLYKRILLLSSRINSQMILFSI